MLTFEFNYDYSIISWTVSFFIEYSKFWNHKEYVILPLFRMGLFGTAHRLGVVGKGLPLPKTFHTYPTITNLGTIIPYQKKVQKNVWTMRHTPSVLLTSTFFHWKSANFAVSRNTDIDCILQIYIISDSFNLFWVLKKWL